MKKFNVYYEDNRTVFADLWYLTVEESEDDNSFSIVGLLSENEISEKVKSFKDFTWAWA
jgi:hypothetical protein